MNNKGILGILIVGILAIGVMGALLYVADSMIGDKQEGEVSLSPFFGLNEDEPLRILPPVINRIKTLYVSEDIDDDDVDENGTIINPPGFTLIADNQAVTLNEDDSITIELECSGSSDLSYLITSEPVNGTLGATSTAGRFVYTPEPNYFGTDEFRFICLSDNVQSNEAVVSISVTGTDDTGIWSQLINRKFTDPSYGSIIYPNLMGQCVNVDDPALAPAIVSTHIHYNLAFEDRNLVIYGFDGYPTEEDVVLNCDGTESSFKLTTCHKIAFPDGTRVICP